MQESKITSSESPSREPVAPTEGSGLPITLDAIRPPQRQAGDDDLFFEEKRDYDSERQQLELRTLKEDIGHRKTYSQSIFNLVRVWLIAVFGAIALDGAGWIEISDGVLIALIGGTTINVVGLFAIVARYFFPKR